MEDRLRITSSFGSQLSDLIEGEQSLLFPSIKSVFGRPMDRPYEPIFEFRFISETEQLAYPVHQQHKMQAELILLRQPATNAVQ